MTRLLLPAIGLLGAVGCCCGTASPPTDAAVRVLAGPEPAVVFVDGAQQTSMSAYGADSFRVPAGHHELRVTIDARERKVPIDVRPGDDVFVPASDAACYAIVEPPAKFADDRPVTVPAGPYSLVKVLQPGEVWPQGDELTHVTGFVTGVNLSLSRRLVVPIDCASKDDPAARDAAIVASLTSMVAKLK